MVVRKLESEYPVLAQFLHEMGIVWTKLNDPYRWSSIDRTDAQHLSLEYVLIGNYILKYNLFGLTLQAMVDVDKPLVDIEFEDESDLIAILRSCKQDT